jgi:CO dehydrogenase maturation factor
MGRGGCGKTSFAALITKYLIEIGQTPMLLIDADPDQNLAETVGVDLEREGKSTISEILIKTFMEEGGTTVGVSPSERIESKIWAKALYEGGCYCLPNNALKGALGNLTRTYRNIIVDSPAGLEHLNRRITSSVDDIFDIVDPSKKAFDHVERAYRIVGEVKISFQNFYIVGGYRFPESMEPDVKKRTNLEYLGKIAYDKNVEEYVLYGKSLLELPDSSPAYQSAKKILKTAGYT